MLIHTLNQTIIYTHTYTTGKLSDNIENPRNRPTQYYEFINGLLAVTPAGIYLYYAYVNKPFSVVYMHTSYLYT